MIDSSHARRFGARASEPGEGVAGEGESLELDAIYRRHAADVSRWVRRLAGQDDVSDLVHEVFVVAQRRVAEFRGSSSVRTWLYGISVRVVSGFRRKRRLRRLFFPEPSADGEPEEGVEPATPDTLVESKRATRAVYRVLERLSERDRTLIVLFELEGLGAAEIEAILGLRPNAVWVALHRARARFRKTFVDLYGVEE